MIAIEFRPGIIVRLLREKRGLAQNQLGVDKTTVSQLELGNRETKREKLKTIAEHLGVTIGEIEAIVESLNRKVAPFRPSACPDNYPEHISYHEMLEDILHNGGKLADWIAGNVVTFYSQMTGEPVDLSALSRKVQDGVILDGSGRKSKKKTGGSNTGIFIGNSGRMLGEGRGRR